MKLKVIGVINDDFTIKTNITCVNLLNEVYLANDSVLSAIFSSGNIQIGCLSVRKNVPVSIDTKTYVLDILPFLQ